MILQCELDVCVTFKNRRAEVLICLDWQTINRSSDCRSFISLCCSRERLKPGGCSADLLEALSRWVAKSSIHISIVPNSMNGGVHWEGMYSGLVASVGGLSPLSLFANSQ